MPTNLQHTALYLEPLVPAHRAVFHFTDLDPAIAMFSQGNHFEAFKKMMNMVSGTEVIDPKHTADQPLELTIPHGSLTLHVSMKDNVITFEIPLVDMGEANSAALLRKSLNINVDEFVLPRIEARGNELWVAFSTPLHLADPEKIYSALYEMCENTDHHDDLFTQKYGATRLEVPEVAPMDEAEAKRVYQIVSNFLNESVERAEYFEQKGQLYSALVVLFIAHFKTIYVAQPRGYVRALLQKMDNLMHDFYNTRGNMQQYLQLCKPALQKVRDLDEEAFIESLYTPSFFVPNRPLLSASQFAEKMRGYVDAAKKDLVTQDFPLAVLRLEDMVYNLLFHHTTDEQLEQDLGALVARISDRPWREAAESMIDNAQAIIDQTGPPPQQAPQNQPPA